MVLHRPGTHDVSLHDRVAEPGREPFDLRLDAFGHVDLRAVRDMAVAPAGLAAVGDTRPVERARLDEEDERSFRVAALLHRLLGVGDLGERAPDVDRGRTGDLGVGPRHRLGELPVDLPHAGAAPEPFELAAIAGREPVAADGDELCRRDIEQRGAS